MSIPMTMQTPAVVLNVGADDAQVPSRVTRGRIEPREKATTSVVLAYRDVVDEVRRRIARLGISWE